MTLARLWSRPLAPLVVALAAGIAAPSLGWALPTAWLPFLALSLLLLLAVCFWRRLPLAWMGCLLFFCLGQGLYHTALDPHLPDHHVRFLPQNTPLTIQGVVHSRPILVGSDYRLELAASSWSTGPDWQSTEGIVWVSGLQEATGLQPGDQVVMRLILRPVEDWRNPGAGGRTLALARRQIFTTGRLWQHLQPVQLASEPALSWLAAWREQAQTYCRRLLAPQPQPARSIFLALLLGDQTEISPSLRQAFNATGATHVLSVSGMHLTIIAGFFTWLSFWLLRRSAWLLLRLNALKWAVCLATIPVLAYVWLAEGSPATQRSAVMILAYMFLVLLDRHRDIYNALILAAFIILVVSPLQLYAISFQLSFLAVWGLALLSPVLLRPWREWLAAREDWPAWKKKPVLWLGAAWSATVAATLATLPVIVANFHQTPTYGLLVNLLVTPLIGGLALVLSFLGLLVSILPGPLDSLLFFAARQVLDFSVFLLEWAAALPGVVLRLPAPTTWQTAAYFLLLVSLFGASRWFWRWTGVSLGILVLTGSLAWSGIRSYTNPALTLTALDTFRELALVATLPDGTAMVINAGAPRYFDTAPKTNTALLASFHTLRRRHLDYLAALTVTPENAGTLLALAQEFEVREFWYGGDRPLLQSFWELRNLLGDRGRVVKNLSLAPISREIGGVQVGTRQLPGSFPNRTSGPVLLQLDYQGNRLLIIPPAPAAWRRHCLAAGLSPHDVVILPAANLKADFLDPCLAQVKPRLVVVTGSPFADLPAALSQDPDCTWHFTRQGAVTLTIAAGKVQVSQFRPD
jgi:competence protein ComEC